MRQFATKNDGKNGPKTDNELFEEQAKKKRGTKKSVEAASETTEPVVKKKRRTKAEIEAAKLEKELLASEKKMKKKQEVKMEPMYTLKFNSPILPYAKFPLTQNKYI